MKNQYRYCPTCEAWVKTATDTCSSCRGPTQIVRPDRVRVDPRQQQPNPSREVKPQ